MTEEGGVQEVTTARALEIILSRVKMDEQTARVLMAQLQAERALSTVPVPLQTPDQLRVHLMAIREEADVHYSFSKGAMLTRFSMIRERVSQMLNEIRR